MEIPEGRKWMYKRLDRNKHLIEEFREGVYEFLQYVISQEKFQEQGEMLRCPCIKCSCKVFKYVDQVGWDLYQEGFMPNYYWWTNHGEELPQSPPMDVASSCYGTCEQREELGRFHQMVMDHVGPSNAHCMQPESVIGSEYMEENPDLETRNFFNMLAAAQAPLWEGCENHSELSASLEALSLKSDYNMSEGCFNRMVQLMGKTMPKDHRMVNNFFQAKKSVEKLGLGCTKIDCCPKGCMLYYREHCHKSITNCFICGMERYKTVTRRGIEKKIVVKKMWYFPIIPRLRRLYSSMATAPHMRWIVRIKGTRLFCLIHLMEKLGSILI
ncbi:uncharacterized protein [Phaseolus vulgaris]|uniref:uncharacterized protein n=1 Tax=Phaseolus vulgaris TaxID=3885 RepID=UPI0035CBF8B4